MLEERPNENCEQVKKKASERMLGRSNVVEQLAQMHSEEGEKAHRQEFRHDLWKVEDWVIFPYLLRLSISLHV